MTTKPRGEPRRVQAQAASASSARTLALRVLQRVEEGAYADRAFLGETARARMEARDRAFAQRLAYGSVQRRRTLDWLIDTALDRPGAMEPALRNVLRLAVFEIGFMDGVPARASVDEAVRLSRSLPGSAARRNARAGLTNAVLRRLSGEVEASLASLGDATPEALSLRHSAPDWIVATLVASIGFEEARAVLARANEAPESALRWNPLKGPRATLERRLPEGARRDAHPEGAYVVDGAFALEESVVWARGLAMAQSRASQLAALALAPRPGERVLDVCAAPGAKATQLCALTTNRAEVTAVELHASRASALRALARRMGARVHVVVGDGRHVSLPGRFDAVLVDAPCTGLGVLAARPDARWRRRQDAVAPLVALQGELLARALDSLAPGGRVVYATCTLNAAENEEVVRASGARVVDLTSRFASLAHPRLPGALLALPHRFGSDGFFVAALE